jgi:hypothetical protein
VSPAQFMKKEIAVVEPRGASKWSNEGCKPSGPRLIGDGAFQQALASSPQDLYGKASRCPAHLVHGDAHGLHRRDAHAVPLGRGQRQRRRHQLLSQRGQPQAQRACRRAGKGAKSTVEKEERSRKTGEGGRKAPPWICRTSGCDPSALAEHTQQSSSLPACPAPALACAEYLRHPPLSATSAAQPASLTSWNGSPSAAAVSSTASPAYAPSAEPPASKSARSVRTSVSRTSSEPSIGP